MGCGASKHGTILAGSGDKPSIVPSTQESAAVTKRTASGNNEMHGGIACQAKLATSFSRTALDLLLSVGTLDPIVQVTAHPPLILQLSANGRDFCSHLLVCVMITRRRSTGDRTNALLFPKKERKRHR